MPPPPPLCAVVDGHAVVVGGSMAGLLAARALSPWFARVTVLDRDTFPVESVSRRGVPQSRHVHAMATRGAHGLEALFPGFLGDLVEAGVPHGDAQADVVRYLDGQRMIQSIADAPVYLMTRPQIESVVRDRVRSLANVTLTERTEVTGLIADGDRAIGVHVRRVNEHDERTLPADFVVDAAGRGSRALFWLNQLGYPVPDETTVRTNTVYVTRHYENDAGLLDGQLAALSAPNPYGGMAHRQERGQIAVMLVGMLGEEPPTDDEGMLAYASRLSAPEIAEVLRKATPLDDPAKMRFSENSRKHFEKLDRYLEGFIVVGDALCALNPVFGQGQTVAVLEAELLQSLLAGGRDKASARYFAQVAGVLAEPWETATGTLPGDDQYLGQFRAAAATDPELGRAYVRVAMMLAPRSTLFAPHLRERVRRSGT